MESSMKRTLLIVLVLSMAVVLSAIYKSTAIADQPAFAIAQSNKEVILPEQASKVAKDKIAALFDRNGEIGDEKFADVSDEVEALISSLGGWKGHTAGYGFTKDGKIEFTVTNNQDLALAKRVGKELGVTITAENSPGLKMQAAGMYRDDDPFYGASRYTSYRSDNGKGYFCSTGYGYNSNATGASIITAGHCVNFPYYESVTSAKDGNNPFMRISRYKVDSVNNSGSVKMSNGGYNGDIARLNVVDGRKIRGAIYYANYSSFYVPGFGSGRNASLTEWPNVELCYSGASTGGERCGFYALNVGFVSKQGSETYRPMTRVQGDHNKNNCPRGGDSGGPVYKKGSRQVIGIMSASNYDYVNLIVPCKFTFTPHGEVREAWAGSNLTDGKVLTGN